MKRTLFALVALSVWAGAVTYADSGLRAPAEQKPPQKRAIAPAGPAAPGLPFSPGLMVGDTLYLSGQLGVDASGQLAAGGFEPEMRQVFANAGAVLKAAGMDFSDVVSVTVYLKDIKDFGQMNNIYKEYFKAEPLPTRSTVAVEDLVRAGKLEITMTAVRSK
jgi:2-iminobutanoate/2-iminopropanoate deaminase